jgi:hypothetical protein
MAVQLNDTIEIPPMYRVEMGYGLSDPKGEKKQNETDDDKCYDATISRVYRL